MKRSTSLEKARVGGPAKGVGSGGPAKGSWPPFEPGNDAAVTHGSYSMLRLSARAPELAAELRDAMGSSFEPRFAGAVGGAALTGARVEAALAALLETTDPSELKSLDDRARGWLRLWFTALEKLGLTPASAAQLGLLRRVSDPLREYLEAEYAEAGDA